MTGCWSNKVVIVAIMPCSSVFSAQFSLVLVNWASYDEKEFQGCFSGNPRQKRHLRMHRSSIFRVCVLDDIFMVEDTTNLIGHALHLKNQAVLEMTIKCNFGLNIFLLFSSADENLREPPPCGFPVQNAFLLPSSLLPGPERVPDLRF